MATKNLELNLRARADIRDIDKLERSIGQLAAAMRRSGAAFDGAADDARRLAQVFGQLSAEEQKQVQSAAKTAAALDQAAAARERASRAAAESLAAEQRIIVAQEAAERAAIQTATANERLAQAQSRTVASVAGAATAEERLAQSRERTLQATARTEREEINVAKAREQLRAATARAEAAEKRMAEARRSSGLATDIVRKQLQAFLAGGTAIMVGKQLLQLGRDSITAASDAEEAGAKFRQVFGDLSEGVRENLEVMAKTNRRSVYDLVDFASTLQDTFVPLGFARDQAADFSQTIVQLGVDIAAFSNQADADVIHNLTSAIVGNHEAVRSYGIVLTETVLKQELARMGAQNLTGAALEMAKAQARVNVIMRASADAQGAAVREADSYSNTLKAWDAAVQDLKVSFGEGLLPAMTDIVDMMSKMSNLTFGKPGQQFAAPFSKMLEGTQTVEDVVRVIRDSKRELDDLDFWETLKIDPLGLVGPEMAKEQFVQLAKVTKDFTEFQRIASQEFNESDIFNFFERDDFNRYIGAYDVEQNLEGVYKIIQARKEAARVTSELTEMEAAWKRQQEQAADLRPAIAAASLALQSDDIAPAWLDETKTRGAMDAMAAWSAELGEFAYASQVAAAAQKEFNIAFGESFNAAPVDDLIKAQQDFRALQQGEGAGAYTGDVDAAEQARDDIIAANKAIQDSYYERAYNSIAARMIEEGNFAAMADVAVSLGIMTREEADLRTQYADTIAVIDELTSSTAFYGMTAAQQAGAVKSLAAGIYDTAAAAMAAQTELKKTQEFFNTAPDSTAIGNYYQQLANGATPDSPAAVTTTVSVSIDPKARKDFELFRTDLTEYDTAIYETTIQANSGSTQNDFEKMQTTLEGLVANTWVIEVEYKTKGSAPGGGGGGGGEPEGKRGPVEKKRDRGAYVDLTVNNYGSGDVSGAVRNGVIAAFRSLG